MPNAISRKELIRKFKALGYSGPLSGGKHQFMIKGSKKIRIPNPHGVLLQSHAQEGKGDKSQIKESGVVQEGIDHIEKGEDFMKIISDAEVEKRLKAWADVTMLSIELKLSMLRQRHPELGEDELRELMRKEHLVMKDKY